MSRTHVDSGLCDPERRQLDLFFTLRYLRNAVTRSTDCVFEKNYRLQDIQLSKNLLGCGLSAFGFVPVALVFKLFVQLAARTRAGLPSRSLPPSGRQGQTPAGKGWWRIPGSNR